MQLSSVLLTLLAVTSTTASPRPGFFGNSQEVIQKDDLEVPGTNPLHYCSAPTDNLLKITNVNLTPNPPKAGTKLTIKAEGELKEKVEKGAKVHLQVKYGLITLIKQDADLCDQITNVNLECPLEKGPIVFNQDVDLPKEIPIGKYHVLADVVDKDNKKITCLTADVTFSLT